MRRRPQIEGLRGLAALSVLSYHVSETTGHTEHNLALTELKAGVVLFFVISGLVLYLPHARAIRDGRAAPDPRDFLRRRVTRILPAYWVVLTLWLVVCLSTMPAGGVFGARSLWWSYYGLASSFSNNTYDGGIPVAWSLCVEFAFYLTLPAIAWGLRRLVERPGLVRSRPAGQLTAMALLALVSLLLRLGLTPTAMDSVDSSHRVAAMSLPLLLDWFIAGMGLAVLAAEWEQNGNFARTLHRLGASALRCRALGLLVLGATVPWQGGDVLIPLDTAVAHVTLALGCALLVLPAIVGKEQRSLLASRPLVWLGTVSYGVYLVHVPVMWELRRLFFGAAVFPRHIVHVGPGSSMLLLAATAIVAVALGALSWYLVERPALAWGARGTPRAAARPVQTLWTRSS